MTEDGKIDQKKWEEKGIEFNKRQRGHQHMFENIADAYALLLTCGLFYPKYAATWALSYIAGTLIYSVGYSIKPNYRVFGSVFFLSANIAWIYGLYCAGTAVYNGKAI